MKVNFLKIRIPKEEATILKIPHSTIDLFKTISSFETV
jgi:hypothetical protein